MLATHMLGVSRGAGLQGSTQECDAGASKALRNHRSGNEIGHMSGLRGSATESCES